MPSDAELEGFNRQMGALWEAARFEDALAQAADVWARGWQHRDVAYTAACAAARTARLDEAYTWLERAADTGMLDIGWMNLDRDLATVRADPRYPGLLARARAAGERHLTAMNVGGGLAVSTPEREGIHAEALRRLVERAAATHSSALVVLRHGRLVGQWYFDDLSTPTETMSATKSVTSVAIGFLLDDGHLRSLDEPVATFFSEWKDGVHDGITVRHLLNHTSGLHADRTTERIYASGDFVHFALGSGIDAAPGAEFFYNNSAVNLLAGVVERASGRSLDRYLGEKLFAPLGIREVTWSHDDKGNPHGMSGLQIHAADFAKVGQLMLQGGLWNGKRVLSESWIRESSERPSQELNPVNGLLWWLEAPRVEQVLDGAFFAALEARGAEPVFVAKLQPLRDRPILSQDFTRALRDTLGTDGVSQWTAQVGQRRLNPRTTVTGSYDGFSARGSFGQRLVVFPDRDLVAVRFTKHFDESDPTVGFDDFSELVRALVPAPP